MVEDEEELEIHELSEEWQDTDKHTSPSEHGLDLLDSTELNLEVSISTQTGRQVKRGCVSLGNADR